MAYSWSSSGKAHLGMYAGLELIWKGSMNMNTWPNSNPWQAFKFNGTLRKMYDISSINTDGVFEEDISKIYPSS